MRISDWSSDVCSSDLEGRLVGQQEVSHGARCSCRRGWRLARAALRADMRCLNSTSAARGHPNPLHPGGPSLYPSGRKQTPGSEMARPRTIDRDAVLRSEEHTSELQSLMRISYAVFCLQ